MMPKNFKKTTLPHTDTENSILYLLSLKFGEKDLQSGWPFDIQRVAGEVSIPYATFWRKVHFARMYTHEMERVFARLEVE